jgi:hypothetical protein
MADENDPMSELIKALHASLSADKQQREAGTNCCFYP